MEFHPSSRLPPDARRPRGVERLGEMANVAHDQVGTPPTNALRRRIAAEAIAANTPCLILRHIARHATPHCHLPARDVVAALRGVSSESFDADTVVVADFNQMAFVCRRVYAR